MLEISIIFIVLYHLKRPIGRQKTILMSVKEKILSAILALVIASALGVLGYVIVTPEEHDKYTEFYILGQEGKIADYPQELIIGETGKVWLVITNHEYQDMSYFVETKLSGTLTETLGPLRLEHDQKWQHDIEISPVKAGENQKVEFLLFREGEKSPYHSLRLWVDIREK